MSDFARGQPYPDILDQALTLVDENFLTSEQASLEQSGNPSFWQKRRHSFIQFLKRPSKQWLVDRVVGERDFVLIYGASGDGKTHVALDCAVASCMGRAFANSFTVARPLSVAYCTGEGIGGLADRLRALNHHFKPDQDIPLFIYDEIPQLFVESGENGVMSFLAEWQLAAAEGSVPQKLDILILDTLHNSTAGSDENSAKDASIIQSRMRLVRDTLSCAIILVHHTNKGGSAERGSSALRAACDTVLRVQKSGLSYTLTCEKLKDGEPWPVQGFQLAEVGNFQKGVRVWWTGNATDAKKVSWADMAVHFLQEHPGQEFTADAIAQGIGLDGASAKNIYRDLKALESAGSVSRKAQGKGQPALWYCTGPVSI